MRRLLFTIVCLAQAVSIAALAQTAGPLSADISLKRIGVDSFQPESIRRGDFATLKFVAFFEAPSGLTRAEARGAISTYIAKTTVVERSGFGLLESIAVNITGVTRKDSPTSESAPSNRLIDYVGEGTITIHGDMVAMSRGFFGQSLLISIVDPETGISSAPVRLRVYGLTNIEILMASLFAIYILGLAGYLYIRKIRRRAQQVEGLELEIKKVRRRQAHELEWTQEMRSGQTPAPPARPVPEVPPALVEQLAARSAVLGIGAGLSQAAGVPGWSTVLISLGKQFSDLLSPSLNRLMVEMVENRRDGPDVNDLSDLFDAISTEVGRYDLITKLRDILDSESGDLHYHKMLAGLPWSGVLSLTFDSVGRSVFVRSFFERSSADERELAILPEQGRALREALQANVPFFLEALGDLKAPASVSLTLPEMRANLQDTPEYARQLALLLDTRCFFFIGVSPGGLKEYLQSFNPNRHQDSIRHYALVPFTPENDRFALMLRRYGVELLEYDERDGLDPLETFLNDLQERVRQKAPAERLNSRQRDGLNPKLARQRLQRLELENVGPFRSLKLDFAEAEGDRADWTVVMGENGIGKSVILRAIATALGAEDDNIRDNAARLLRQGAQSGRIALDIGQQTLDVTLLRDRVVRLHAKQTSPVEAGQILVLGFPALRGAPSLDPAGPRQIEARPPEPADLSPVATGDVDPRMAHFKQWIVNVLSHSKTDKKSAVIRELLDEIVAELVPGDFAGFADLDETNVLRLKVGERGGETVPFTTVSQGMTSIFNWIGLLAKRMYEVYELDADRRPHLQHAIVLIDEIDAHLHPDWQRRLVALAKAFFPSVQVVATTHSPLIASSLEARELRVLERDADGNARLWSPSVQTYGQSADFIMQSEVMGLDNARPAEVEHMIQRYVSLYSSRDLSETDEKELVAFREKLSAIGWSGVAEMDASDRPDPTPEDIRKFIDSYRT